RFDLDRLLDFVTGLAARAFGVRFQVRRDAGGGWIAVESGGAPAGHIRLDVWDTATRRIVAPGELIRAGQPVAHIACRYRQAGKGRPALSFKSAGTLFHEFGHALTHVLVRRRIPSLAGLDYLPLERLD